MGHRIPPFSTPTTCAPCVHEGRAPYQDTRALLPTFLVCCPCTYTVRDSGPGWTPASELAWRQRGYSRAQCVEDGAQCPFPKPRERPPSLPLYPSAGVLAAPKPFLFLLHPFFFACHRETSRQLT